MVQIFVIEPTGETQELGIGGNKPVKEFLSTNEVYIVVDEVLKKCFLWKGKNSRIRSKFIGAKKSQDVRGQVGLSFKVEPVDEEEEPDDFKASITQVPQPGHAKEIREEGEGPKFLKDLDFSKPEKIATEPIRSSPAPGSVASTPAPAPAAAPQASVAKPYAKSPENVGPIYTGTHEVAAAPKAATPPADYKKIMETLTGLDTPTGYEREMVIIGSQTFSIVEKATSFLGQRVVKKEMEPIGSLPEGVFFAEGYAPRVLCENGKVLAIEFLKKVKGATDRVSSVARAGALPSAKSTPALPAASATNVAPAASAAPARVPATPTVSAAGTPAKGPAASTSPSKPHPPLPKLPGQTTPAATEGPAPTSLKDHLAKTGQKDLKKAFGIRVGKKEDDKKK